MAVSPLRCSVLSGSPDIETIPLTGGAMDTMNEINLSSCPALPILPTGGGENGMARKKPFRRGLVRITDLGQGKWRFRWQGPGGDKRFDGDKKTIVKIADGITQKLYVQKGLIPGMPRPFPNIRDAVPEAIRLSKAGRDQKLENARNGGRFCDWLEKRYPAVRTFDQLMPSMIQEYINEVEEWGYVDKESGKRKPYKIDAIRAFIKPISLTWHHIREDYKQYGFPEWTEVKIKTRRGPKLPQLQPMEIQILFEYLKTHHQLYYPVAVMQALTGLRPVEIRSLRRQDIDLQRGIISVRDTETHTTKNETSCREIPVCSEVVTILVETINGLKVIPSTGEIFLRGDGSPWTEQTLTKCWKPETRKRAANETKCPQLAEVTAYRLRASFSSMASRLGVPDHLLKAYFGHSTSGNMLDKHYREIPLSELRKVSAAMEHWRDLPNEDEFGEDLGNSSEGKLGTC